MLKVGLPAALIKGRIHHHAVHLTAGERQEVILLHVKALGLQYRGMECRDLDTGSAGLRQEVCQPLECLGKVPAPQANPEVIARIGVDRTGKQQHPRLAHQPVTELLHASLE